MADPSIATRTDWAAWIGAATGTLALGWEILKHFREGARLVVDVRVNGVTIRSGGAGHPSRARVLTLITISNVGDRPTTITGLYRTSYRRSFGRRVETDGPLYIEAEPYEGKLYPPFLLQPGETWSSVVEQDALEELCRNGKKVLLSVEHSSSKKGIYRRVEFPAS
jgi:hypothetical protein